MIYEVPPFFPYLVTNYCPCQIIKTIDQVQSPHLRFHYERERGTRCAEWTAISDLMETHCTGHPPPSSVEVSISSVYIFVCV